MSLTIASTIKLSSGAAIPRLGFGAFELKDGLASSLKALEYGYRHIDTVGCGT